MLLAFDQCLAHCKCYCHYYHYSYLLIIDAGHLYFKTIIFNWIK